MRNCCASDGHVLCLFFGWPRSYDEGVLPQHSKVSVMQAIDPTSTVRPMRLRGGQALQIPVRPGTAVQVLAGSLSLSGPARWLAETVHRVPQRIGEGQWLLLEDGGWLELEAASGEAQLLLVEPAEPVAWLWRRLRSLLSGSVLAHQRT